MRAFALSVFFPLPFLAACGPRAVEHEIEERPLDQASALDQIQQALGERDVQSERFVPVLLPDGSNYVLDVVGTNLPVAVEFLTPQDRERVGALLPVQASPDETPRLVLVRRPGLASPQADLYLRVFTDEHFRFQPNPPSDMPEAPYTIREVSARLRRDVKDFVSWYRSNHAAPGAATP